MQLEQKRTLVTKYSIVHGRLNFAKIAEYAVLEVEKEFAEKVKVGEPMKLQRAAKIATDMVMYFPTQMVVRSFPKRIRLMYSKNFLPKHDASRKNVARFVRQIFNPVVRNARMRLMIEGKISAK